MCQKELNVRYPWRVTAFEKEVAAEAAAAAEEATMRAAMDGVVGSECSVDVH